jgi:hypothetical protein
VPLLKREKVDKNSLMEFPKCSMMIRLRYHTTIRRDERMEYPLDFKVKLGKHSREKYREKLRRECHLIRVLRLII